MSMKNSSLHNWTFERLDSLRWTALVVDVDSAVVVGKPAVEHSEAPGVLSYFEVF